MDWTSIYLKTSNLNVFILGTGEVATRRANKFLDHGANVRLAGNHFSSDLESKGAVLYSTDEVDDLVKWADLVVVASGDEKLADYVCEISQDKLINRADLVVIASGDKSLSDYVASISKEKLLNRADAPNEGNVIVPTSFNIGDVEISIFTNGKSPLMAKQLRKKIQAIITDEDILDIELQDYARLKLKDKISDSKQRREYLYDIFTDEKINEFIKNDEIDNAKEYINDFIRGLN